MWDSYIHPELTEAEMVINQYNLEMGLDITLDDVEILNLRETNQDEVDLDNPNLNIKQNSSILIRAKSTSDKVGGEALFFYRRIDLEKQWNKTTGGNIRVQVPKVNLDVETIHEVLKQHFIYRKESTELRFSFDDQHDTGMIVLEPIDNSLIYIGRLELSIYKDQDFVNITNGFVYNPTPTPAFNYNNQTQPTDIVITP